MFKTLITLVRGRTAVLAEEVADQNALLILDQQMRDATGALDRAKKALAIAIAQGGRKANGWMRPAPGSMISRRERSPRSRPAARISQQRPRRRSPPWRPNAMPRQRLAPFLPPRSPS